MLDSNLNEISVIRNSIQSLNDSQWTYNKAIYMEIWNLCISGTFEFGLQVLLRVSVNKHIFNIYYKEYPFIKLLYHCFRNINPKLP